MASTTTPTTSVAPLRRDAVGLLEVLFQSMTSMAPAAAIAASIPLGAAYAAGALPLAVLIAFVGILLSAWSIGQLAKHIPAAGSVATYSAAGLSPWVGFLVGWGYTAMQVLVLPLVMLQLGFTVAGEWHSEQASFSTGLWWIFTVAGTALVCFLVYRGVRTSTRAGVYLGSIEIAVFLGLAIALVVKAGERQHAAGLHDPLRQRQGLRWHERGRGRGCRHPARLRRLRVGGGTGRRGQAAAAQHPSRRADGDRADRWAVPVHDLRGGRRLRPGKLAGFASASNGVPWSGLARTVTNVLWVVVLFAIINSTLACANANTNVFTRTGYALGRIGVLPRGLSNLHPRFRSPRIGVLVELIVGLAVTLSLGLHYTPEVAFGVVGTAIVVVIVPIYIMANIACIGYYGRHRREEHNWIAHVVVPVIGAAALVPGFLSAAGITGVPGLKFIVALPSPYKYAPYVMAAWMVAGVVMLFVLRARNAQAIEAVAHIHLDDEEIAPMAAAEAEASEVA